MINIDIGFNKIECIAHIADVHIRNLRRHKEYKQVFRKLYKDLKQNLPDNLQGIDMFGAGPISGREFDKALSKLVLKHDLWVLSDDDYYEIRYSQNPPNSILNFPGMKQRTVILYTFSKKYAMTGWRIGASIGPESLIKHMARFNINDESCTNHFIQHALASVLNDSNDYGEEIIKKLIKRRDLCLKKLNSINDLDISTPESTFYLFPNVSKIMDKKGYDNLEKFRVEALKNTGISFCTREHFGTPFLNENEQYIRFAYSGISKKDISEGLDKFINWIN